MANSWHQIYCSVSRSIALYCNEILLDEHRRCSFSHDERMRMAEIKASSRKEDNNTFIVSSLYIQSFQSADAIYLNRLASRSHSNKQRISPSRTGPFTFRTILRPDKPPDSASINSTRTCVTLPVFPVRPRTRFTFASLTGWSCKCYIMIQFRRSENGDEFRSTPAKKSMSKIL